MRIIGAMSPLFRQWGYLLNTSNVQVNFPVAFPVKCFSVITQSTGLHDASGSLAVFQIADSLTTTGYIQRGASGGSTTSFTGYYYIAIGY